MNVWNLWKLGASRFHLQHASLEIDLNIYMCSKQLYFMVNCDRLCLQYCLQWINGL